MNETEISEYCAVMAAQHREANDLATAARFALLSERHRDRASRRYSHQHSADAAVVGERRMVRREGTTAVLRRTG